MHSRWFKNAICLRYEAEEKLSQAAWEPILKKLHHRPIKSTEQQSIGFSPAFGFYAPKLMCHELQNFLYVSLTVEEKKVPKNKLRKMLNHRIKEFAKNEKREFNDITKEEKETLRDEVTLKLLKDIIPDETYIPVFIDTSSKLIYLDTTSPKNVTRAVEWLQRIEKSLKTKPFFDASLEIFLTQWVYEPDTYMPNDLALDSDATLKHHDKSKAVFSQQDLASNELIELINHDKKVIELGLMYQGRLGFKLKSDGSLKKIKPTDLLKGDIDRPDEVDSITQDIEADWLAMSNELSRLYQWFNEIIDVNNPTTETKSSGTVTQFPSQENSNQLEESIEQLSGMNNL